MGTQITVNRPDRVQKSTGAGLREARGAFFWLSAFYVVYCTRPEDWIPVVGHLPLAKISAILALIGLFASLGRTKRGMKTLPAESKYLLAMILLLFVGAPFSPVWRGGAVEHTMDFGKVYFVWILTFLLVTSVARLRRLIFIQAGSVAVVSIVSVLKGSSHPRLQGALGGIYSNPNDLAFAIVLTFPLTLLLLLTSKSMPRKAVWGVCMLVMSYALLRTASRAGFIDLAISIPILLWFFGVKGRRPQLIFAVAVIGVLLLATEGKQLKDRFLAISGTGFQSDIDRSAYGSFEDRKFLMQKALRGIVEHPLMGVGTGNFKTYSGVWRDVHMSYLQIAVEGGIPALILYLLFFVSGFRNLLNLNRRKNLDPEIRLIVGALFTCLVGFMVGAFFAPEAYQYFPYFTVAYILALRATVEEGEAEVIPGGLPGRNRRFRNLYAKYERPNAVGAGTVTPVR
jgi:O-antigen ligase